MTSLRGRGRGGGQNFVPLGQGHGGGNGNGNGNQNQNQGGPNVAGQGGRGGMPDGNSPRRGAWRGGPPGSGPNGSSRVNSPVITGPGGGPTGPRQSINDHMNDLRKVDVAKGKGFQTDTDISGSTSIAERELKPWVPDAPGAAAASPSPAPPASNGSAAAAAGRQSGPASGRDSETFGAAPTSGWDQFEANARLFGTQTSWAEEIYTTKLDRSGPGYKKKEKEADRLAGEIMGQTASNPHVAEERNQAEAGDGKDEEEKYSGVVRNPNAYVPPGARKGPPGRASAPGPGMSPSTPAAQVLSPQLPKANGQALSPVPKAEAALPAAPAASTKSSAPAPAAPSSALSPPKQAGRSAFNGETGPSGVAPASPAPEKGTEGLAAPALAMAKSDSKDGRNVVDSFRQFVGTEREKVEAKKQSMAKTERERQLADLKSFQASFRVPLPMPKDILPILAKDEAKQKALEAKAAEALKAAAAAKNAQASPKVATSPSQTKTSPTKKVAMKIQEIPAFNAVKRKPPTLPVPDSATVSQNIPQATSPSPSDASLASTAAKPNLNPKASTFVFKPNPGAAAFKPGQSSIAATPPAPQAAPVAPQAAAGPSTQVYKNPFFREPPRRVAVNPREDFHPWRHTQVPQASAIPPQWPYSGRKYLIGFTMSAQQGPFEEEGTSPHIIPPQLAPGIPPNFPPYASGYRFNQPNMPQQPIPGNMGGNPMFSPGPGYSPMQGQHIPPLGGPQQNGMPMYFQNGMPHNPHFMPPQHMQQFNPSSSPYNPSTPQRQQQGPGGHGHGNGPGPGSGPVQHQGGGPGQGQGPGPGQGQGHGQNHGGPGPMFYSPNSISTPQQTPQMQHNMPFPPSHGPGPYSPMPPQGQLQPPGQ